MKRTSWAFGLAGALLAAACSGAPTLPSSNNPTSLLGLWTSVSSAASTPGTCAAIAASGTASLTNDGGILIPYSGTTCLGPVSGTQIIRKR